MWSVTDENGVEVNDGSFLYLIYKYETKIIDIDVPVSSEVGDYVFNVGVPDHQVTGSATYPFTVYDTFGWLFGPGWFVLVAVVIVLILFGFYRFVL